MCTRSFRGSSSSTFGGVSVRPNAVVALRRRLSHRKLIPKAIGFRFDEDPDLLPATRKGLANYSNFGLLASSLLVYQHVLKTGVGEAFLATVTTANKYQAKNKEIVEAYSRFFQLLLLTGYSSWQEYVLDQILTGRDNPYARAVAAGDADEEAPVLRAVAYDLDVLQQLAVGLEDLVEYIHSVAPTATSYWCEAAVSTSMDKVRGALPGGASAPTQEALDLKDTSFFIRAPPTKNQLRLWKDAITSKGNWSEAAHLIWQYHHLHGYGITSKTSALRWTKGALEEVEWEDDDFTPDRFPSTLPLSVHRDLQEELAANTQFHCDPFGAGYLASGHHVLVAGPPGSGKSWLLWEHTLRTGAASGLRVVLVPLEEFPNILDIARGCGRYPRVRFVLVADNVDFPVRGPAAAALTSGLEGAGGSGWPLNTLLYVGASSSSTISYGDPIVSRFGRVLTTPVVTEERFITAVKELWRKTDLEQGELSQALEWAGQHGGMSLRTALQYVKHRRGSC